MGGEVIVLIIAGAFAGGFANGLAGFGTGLFALGWWLAAMPPLDAVITVVILSLVGGVQGLYGFATLLILASNCDFCYQL
jgi:uncharacterized protein